MEQKDLAKIGISKMVYFLAARLDNSVNSRKFKQDGSAIKGTSQTVNTFK